jgi:hypothetical protein
MRNNLLSQIHNTIYSLPLDKELGTYGTTTTIHSDNTVGHLKNSVTEGKIP